MGLFQKPPTGSFSLFYILIFIYFFEYETIALSEVAPGLLAIQISIQAVCSEYMNFKPMAFLFQYFNMILP